MQPLIFLFKIWSKGKNGNFCSARSREQKYIFAGAAFWTKMVGCLFSVQSAINLPSVWAASRVLVLMQFYPKMVGPSPDVGTRVYQAPVQITPLSPPYTFSADRAGAEMFDNWIPWHRPAAERPTAWLRFCSVWASLQPPSLPLPLLLQGSMRGLTGCVLWQTGINHWIRDTEGALVEVNILLIIFV